MSECVYIFQSMTKMPKYKVASLILFVGLYSSAVVAQEIQVIDDFERYEENEPPFRWKIPDRASRSMLPILSDHEKPNEFMTVVKDGNGNVLRAYTQNEAVQLALPQGDGLDWNILMYPRLRWRWRADVLPEGAMEDTRSLNDTGAAVYVAFACNDWLGRPCTIKYTYSSSLPEGTRAKYGKLHVVVASSGVESMGEWVEVDRNVLEDFRMIFDRQPPGNPIYIMVWNDSDTTNGESDVYFDDILISTVE
ncbi:MAG: DUF3047 domain-containing protein [Bacteroidetes bacterium]|nr:DUF3047 domain-containing protein [Bacteroidota bacterium]